MNDTSELREAIQTFGSQAINEDDLNEILDRLEAAEKERDALRSKIAEMGRQEPVAEWLPLDSGEDTRRD